LRRSLVLLALATFLLPPGRAAAAACPPSQAQLVGFNSLFTVPGATFDTTLTVPGYGALGGAGFDLVAGTLSMWRAVGGVNWTRVIATDAYDVIGVAPGTPVALTALLDVSGLLTSPGCGGSGCGGWFQASITQGPANASLQQTFADAFAGGDVDVSQTLALPITITAGMPVTLQFEEAVFIPAGGNAGGSGHGTIRFAGLPGGVAVVSCRGYGVAATPARASSWGRLKAVYR